MKSQDSSGKAGRKPTPAQFAYTMLTFVLVSYILLGPAASAVVAVPFLIYLVKNIKQNGRKP